MRALALVLLLSALLPFPAIAQDRQVEFAEQLPDAVDRRTVVIERRAGDGPEAERGKFVVLDYEGFVYDLTKPDRKGLKFDSTRDRGAALSVLIGVNRMIPGIDRGVLGMKVGGHRTIVVPPKMGYGSRTAFGEIPPDSTLIFEVELLDVVAERNVP